MREITLRHIHHGVHDDKILEPLLELTRESGVTIVKLYPVPEADVYLEGVLPPVVTLFCDTELLCDEEGFVNQVAPGIKKVIDNYMSIGRNGYTTAKGEFSEASDLGVFVTMGEALAKYYFKPHDFSAEGLRAIRTTFDSPALAWAAFDHQTDQVKIIAVANDEARGVDNLQGILVGDVLGRN